MKPPLLYRRRCSEPEVRGQRGVTMVLVAVAMVAIIAMAALSIDVVTLYLARMEAQRSADGAALAAARVISLSGLTGDPGNGWGTWALICGGAASPASQAGAAAAAQNTVGSVAPMVTVLYSAGGSAPVPDCSALPAAFGVNPLVTVQVKRTGLPTFFSRIWGYRGNTVSATATAEVFNPSNSGNVSNGPVGTITPVQPRCVKPWIVPNLDPLSSPSCTNNCTPFVDTGTGSILRPGYSLNGAGSNAAIGETFSLVPDCHYFPATCSLRITNPNTTPQANYPAHPPHTPSPPNLQYLPGQTLYASTAVPSCAKSSSYYENAIEGCDQSTVYQCGVQNMNVVDLSENPAGSGDTANGVQCLIDEEDLTDPVQPDGQDSLNPYAAPAAFPFQILAGTSNLLVGSGLASGTPITSSSSIVSLPIFDSGNNSIHAAGTSQVTIVGFLQVFINAADRYGNVNVTVLNVAGCSNGQSQAVGQAVTGTSPVPVRLITSP